MRISDWSSDVCSSDLVEALIKELDRESKTSQEWMSKLKKLEQMVEHHVREEEGEIFKKAREAIDDDDARRMGEDYEKLKQRKRQKKTDRDTRRKNGSA